jgi:hypothetical protein
MVSTEYACSYDANHTFQQALLERSGNHVENPTYVECPSCHMQYLMKDFGLIYSNGAYIENVAGSPEWQRLICPCQPQNPHKFKLKERTRLHVFQESDSEQTDFSLRPVKAMK